MSELQLDALAGGDLLMSELITQGEAARGGGSEKELRVGNLSELVLRAYHDSNGLFLIRMGKIVGTSS